MITYHHQVNVILAICAAFLVVRGPIAVIDAYDLIRWLKKRRSRPVPAWRTPARMIRRPALRPDDPWMDPTMPDENEIRRYGNPDYGPPHIEPAQPVPTRTRPDRRGLVAGTIAFLATILVGVVAGGVYLLTRSSSPAARVSGSPAAASTAPSVSDLVARMSAARLIEARSCKRESAQPPATGQERCSAAAGHEVVIIAFADPAGVDDRIGFFQSSPLKVALLRGPTWIVNFDDLTARQRAKIQAGLGGTAVTAGG